MTIAQVAAKHNCEFSKLGNSVLSRRGRLRIKDGCVTLWLADYSSEIGTPEQARDAALGELQRFIISFKLWGIGFKAELKPGGVEAALKVIGVLTNSELLREAKYNVELDKLYDRIIREDCENSRVA